MGTGQTAPNPAEEVVKFHTATMSLRYGVSRRVNLNVSLPYYSIDSDKVQGEPYRRVNRGFGDLVVTGEYSVLTSPQVSLEAGIRFPTGNVDKVDEFGQRICDILALGSGTTDLLIGAAAWVPHAGMQDLSLYLRGRHRFSGGENKWGYRFGDETTFSLHAAYPVGTRYHLGLRAEAFHTEPDTWFNNTVPERGATMLYLGPTFSMTVSPELAVGLFTRSPVLMDLEGAQMVAPVIVGLEFSTNLTSVLQAVRGGEE